MKPTITVLANAVIPIGRFGNKHISVERQKRDAKYAISCIARVMASPADIREGIERNGGDVLEYALSERVSRNP